MHHIAWVEALEQAAHQAEFSAAFALIRPDRRIQRSTGGQANHHDQARQRKTNTSGLRAGLGIHRLVLRGVGHRQSGAIHQLDCTTAPAPLRQRLLAEQQARLARERTDQLQRQPLARPAIAAGANATSAQTIGRALRGPPVDRLLARAIGLQNLPHEDRQRHRRRIQPLSVLGQQRFGRLQQLRTRQQVEELHGLGRLRAAIDAASALMQNALTSTIHAGWPLVDGLGAS